MANPSRSKMLQGASSRYGGSPKTLCRGQLVNNKMVTSYEALTNYALDPNCNANVRHDQQLEPSNTRSFGIVRKRLPSCCEMCHGKLDVTRQITSSAPTRLGSAKFNPCEDSGSRLDGFRSAVLAKFSSGTESMNLRAMLVNNEHEF